MNTAAILLALLIPSPSSTDRALEDLRREMFRLRERVAVLKAERVAPAPAVRRPVPARSLAELPPRMVDCRDCRRGASIRTDPRELHCLERRRVVHVHRYILGTDRDVRPVRWARENTGNGLEDEMKLRIESFGQPIELTTKHSASSDNIPVPLVDGGLTDDDLAKLSAHGAGRRSVQLFDHDGNLVCNFILHRDWLEIGPPRR